MAGQDMCHMLKPKEVEEHETEISEVVKHLCP